jgi:hypothetical protein
MMKEGGGEKVKWLPAKRVAKRRGRVKHRASIALTESTESTESTECLRDVSSSICRPQSRVTTAIWMHLMLFVNLMTGVIVQPLLHSCYRNANRRVC